MYAISMQASAGFTDMQKRSHAGDWPVFASAAPPPDASNAAANTGRRSVRSGSYVV